MKTFSRYMTIISALNAITFTSPLFAVGAVIWGALAVFTTIQSR